MKKIKLTKEQFAIVDNKDFEYLNQFRWYLSTSGYAKRNKNILMHRLINKTPKELFTDHINRNKLDNRKENLRSVTKSENGFNVGLSSNNKSGFKGVYWDKFTNKWRAELKINYKKITLGRFIGIKDAILARKKAERIYHVI